MANGAYIGEILGLALTGIIVERYGNKATMAGATVLMVAFIFISFFGNSLPLQLGRLLKMEMSAFSISLAGWQGRRIGKERCGS